MHRGAVGRDRRAMLTMRRIRGLLCGALVVVAAWAPAALSVNLPVTAQQVTAVAGAAQINTDAGIVTTQALTTAAAATATFTVGCQAATASSLVLVSLQNGTNTTGVPVIQSVTPGNGVVTIVVLNAAAAAALNGTLKLSLIVFN
jgi:hypothetical protein